MSPEDLNPGGLWEKSGKMSRELLQMLFLMMLLTLFCFCTEANVLNVLVRYPCVMPEGHSATRVLQKKHPTLNLIVKAESWKPLPAQPRLPLSSFSLPEENPVFSSRTGCVASSVTCCRFCFPISLLQGRESRRLQPETQWLPLDLRESSPPNLPLVVFASPPPSV